MTVYEFIDKIEEYYGKYSNETLKRIIRSYLVKTYREDELENLYANTLKHWSQSYGNNKTPDIAIFEEVRKKYDVKKLPEYKLQYEEPEALSDEERKEISDMMQKTLKDLAEKKRLKKQSKKQGVSHDQ